MKLINGSGAVLGRLASYVAKESMKGEDVVIVNCGEVIITGRKRKIKEEFEEKRTKVGSGQKGPKISRTSEKVVKRAVRGMLPNHRSGRGKEAFRRITCHKEVPDEFRDKKMIEMKRDKVKHAKVGEIVNG